MIGLHVHLLVRHMLITMVKNCTFLSAAAAAAAAVLDLVGTGTRP